MILFIAIVQGLLFLAHALVFQTLNYFWGKPRIPHLLELFILLSVSFVPASLLVWRYTHFFAWGFYRLAAMWLGCLSFLFWGSVLCWIAYAVVQAYGLFGSAPHRADYGRGLLLVVFGTALLASFAAWINASWLRLTQVDVKLPGLPDAWRNRTAVLVSDLHLGPVRGFCFAKSVVARIQALKPEVVFIAGDFYDGTAIDEKRIAGAWKEFRCQHGVFYVTGNHEEFSDRTKYLNAIRETGIRILRNEHFTIDGVQIAGVLYGETREPETLRSVLRNMRLDSAKPTILLSHVPQHLDIPEAAGISLQLSGHTHKGQILPWSWVAARVHGRFVYGLNQFKRMLVYTSSGAGTWGPPMRLGTRSEIVLFRFV